MWQDVDIPHYGVVHVLHGAQHRLQAYLAKVLKTVYNQHAKLTMSCEWCASVCDWVPGKYARRGVDNSCPRFD